MSNQIEDLIANIEQKFDDEFRQVNQVQSASKAQSMSRYNEENNYNPQAPSEEKVDKINNVNISKVGERRTQEIVIEDDQQHEETSHPDEIQDKESQKQLHSHEDQNQEKEYEQGDEQGENKYKELSYKLETALKKISSSKNGFQTLSGSQSAALFDRFREYQKKKERDLDMKRKLQQQKKYHGLKSKPDINAKSKLIAQQTSYKPIYQRCDQIIQEKKKKMEQNEENKKLKEQQQFQWFMNECKKHAKVQPDSCRDINTYFNDMIAWKSKVEKEREQKVKQKQKKQTEGYTFKPQLNQKSVRMLKNQKRVPIHEREIERPKTEQSEYTFQPKINKRRVK